MLVSSFRGQTQYLETTSFWRATENAYHLQKALIFSLEYGKENCKMEINTCLIKPL